MYIYIYKYISVAILAQGIFSVLFHGILPAALDELRDFTAAPLLLSIQARVNPYQESSCFPALALVLVSSPQSSLHCHGVYRSIDRSQQRSFAREHWYPH
jgi:hypothetical protein